MCSSCGRVETSNEHDARFGSHSRTAPERRPPYVYCMEINNWPPYSSFDELSGGSIMSVWAWAAAFGRQWRRPRSPASRSARYYSNMSSSDRGTSPMSYIYRGLVRKDPLISSSMGFQSLVFDPGEVRVPTRQGYVEGGRKCVQFSFSG